MQKLPFFKRIWNAHDLLWRPSKSQTKKSKHSFFYLLKTQKANAFMFFKSMQCFLNTQRVNFAPRLLQMPRRVRHICQASSKRTKKRQTRTLRIKFGPYTNATHTVWHFSHCFRMSLTHKHKGLLAANTNTFQVCFRNKFTSEQCQSYMLLSFGY